jgi:hypothetical protein
MKFQLGAMTVGDILDRGLKLTFSRLGSFYAINFLVLLPLIVFAVLAVPLAAMSGSVLMVLLMGLLVLILTLILSPIGSAAVLKVIAGEYADQKVSTGEALNFAMGRFGALLGTSLLAGLIIFLGLLALIIPGIILAVSYSFVGQVVVLEGLNGMDALNRSRSLSLGYRWRIFGILFLIGFLQGILQQVINAALNAGLPLGTYVQTAYGPVLADINFTNYAIHQFIIVLVNILLTTYQVVCLTLMYFDLRVRKEGYDLELAARQEAAPAEVV